MSLSARTPSTLDTNKFIPEIFSKKVQEAVKSELVAWDAITSEWRDDLVKGDTLYITKTNTVTATEVVVGTKATALNPFNTTPTTLTINQWYEAPADPDDMSMFQSQVELEDWAVKECSYAVKVKIDSTVCDLFSSLGGYSTSAYGSDGQTLTDDLLIYLMETLDESNVPRDGKRSLILDPSGVADMLKEDKFVQSLYVQMGAVESGIIAKNHPIYGCAVRVTNNLTAATTGAYACMLHAKAIVSKAQINRSWVKRFEELHQTRFQSEALWGVAEHMDAFGIPFYSRKK